MKKPDHKMLRHNKNKNLTQKNILNSNENLLFGLHSCIAALNNQHRKINKIYLTQENSKKKELQSALKNHPDVQISLLQRKEIDQMLPQQVHNGIALDSNPLPTPDLQDIITQSQQVDKYAIAILDLACDPHNIGAIIRSALAFDISAIITTERNTPKLNGTIAKSSSGAIEKIPLVNVVNLQRAITQLKENDFWIAGLDTSSNSISLNKAQLNNKMAFILGSEQSGMRRLTKQNCDFMLNIRINNVMESLNISNAAAITFYHWFCQKT